MHGLNKNVDLSFLNGREVIQVAIGTHQVTFAFDEDVSISVEGEFTYSNGRNESIWKPGASHIAAGTVALLGAKIEALEAHENGTIKLLFSNGNHLTIPDSSSEYESYNITRPGETIVV